MPLPAAETGQPRTRSASLCGFDGNLYFTRYWTDTLPGALCPFYAVSGGDTNNPWSTLAPAPKFVQDAPGWFSTNIMMVWAGNGLSPGMADGFNFLFMFGSVPKGGSGEDINRDLLGYNIRNDIWEIVTNNYDTGGTDAGCTYVDQDSIYGFWTGWTPMQRWDWNKNGQGIVQQQTVGAAALHPVDGTKVGDFCAFIVFKQNQTSGRLISIPKGGLTVTEVMDLPFNLGMGCAIEYVPAMYTLSGNDELWVLRGGSGDNSGDGQLNNTPNKDVAVLEITTNASAFQVTSYRTFQLPFDTGAEGADMARVAGNMYFLRYDGAVNPELFFIPTTYSVEDPNPGPWPLNGNNKQREGSYIGGADFYGGYLVWTNRQQVGMGIWGSGVSDEDQYYICLDANGASQPYELLVLDVDTGLQVWGADLDEWVNGTPAVSMDRVYAGDNSGKLYSFDKVSGTNIWQTPLPGGDCNGGLLLHSGMLFAELHSATTGGLYCLDAETGGVLWLNPYVQANAWGGNGPSMSPDQSTIYTHSEPGDIRATDVAGGTTIWMQSFGSGLGGMEPIVDDTGNIYCVFGGVNNPGDNDIIVSFAPDGTTNWVYDMGMNDAMSHGGYSLSPAGDTIYCSRRSGAGQAGIGITAVNTADGTEKWSVNCGDTKGSCVVAAPGDIIVGAFEDSAGVAAKGIRDYGSYGRVIWSVPFDNAGGSHSWPGLLPNGDIIVAGDNGVIGRIGVSNYPAIGWCNLQWPHTLSPAVTGRDDVATDIDYRQVWIDGVTVVPGPTPDLTAMIGWGPTNEAPDDGSWTWQNTEFNLESGNNDEYWTNIIVGVATPMGDYGYCYRYQYSPGSVIGELVYGQKDGPHSIDTINPAEYGILTVVPEPGCISILLLSLLLIRRR